MNAYRNYVPWGRISVNKCKKPEVKHAHIYRHIPENCINQPTFHFTLNFTLILKKVIHICKIHEEFISLILQHNPTIRRIYISICNWQYFGIHRVIPSAHHTQNYFYIWIHTLRSIAVDIHKIHILLVHKFLVLGIFTNSYKIFKISMCLLQLILLVYTAYTCWRIFSAKGEICYHVVLSFCMHSCSCTMALWWPVPQFETMCQIKTFASEWAVCDWKHSHALECYTVGGDSM